MRMMVKRLLKKYKYPPEGEEEAMKTVISQCEMWTDTGAEYFEVHAVKPAYQQGLAMVAEEKVEYTTDK